VTQVCEAHKRVIVSFLQQMQGGTRPTTEGSKEKIGHNVHVEEISLLVFTILRTSVSVFYVKSARDIVTVLLIFAKYLSLYVHIFTCTYGGTHTQAHMYNQHTRGIATARHRSLVGRGGRKALL